MTPKEVVDFMHLIQIGFCLFGAAILFLINKHIKSNKGDDRKDFGLDFIAGVLVVWAIQSYGTGDPKYDLILSVINNGFLLASLTYFIHGFERIRAKFRIFRESNEWVKFIFLCSMLVCAFLFSSIPEDVSTCFDWLYSEFVVMSVGYAIIFAFHKRGYGSRFVVLGVFFVIVTVYSQWITAWKLTSDRELWENALVVCSQISFILLLLILAQTWAVEVEQQKVSSNTLKENIQKNSGMAIPQPISKPSSSLLVGTKLKIGLVDDGNGKYFFELTHPKFEKPYSTRINRPTNVFKFLLSLANARKIGVPHKIKIKAAGTSIYLSADFNNILIRDLNDKLTRERFSRITKEDLLSEIEGNWELSIPAENIELLKLEEMKTDEQLSEIFQA